MAENDREAVAERLGPSLAELRHDRYPHPDSQPRSPLAVPRGYSAVHGTDDRAAAGAGGRARLGRIRGGLTKPDFLLRRN